MRRPTSKKTIKAFLMVAIAGLALTTLSGCGLWLGPYRHAYNGGPYHRGGYGYRGVPAEAPGFTPYGRDYDDATRYDTQRRGYCGW